MAHVARSIEIDAPVDAIHAQWLRFEARCGMESVVANVPWRGELLTFEPLPTGTRVTLRIKFDPAGADPALAARVEALLERFAAFAAFTAAAAPHPA